MTDIVAFKYRCGFCVNMDDSKPLHGFVQCKKMPAWKFVSPSSQCQLSPSRHRMTDALVTTYGNYSTALKELDEVDSRIIGLRDALAVEQPQKEIEKLAKALDSAIGWRKHCFSVYLGSLTKLQQRTSDKFPGMFKESGD